MSTRVFLGRRKKSSLGHVKYQLQRLIERDGLDCYWCGRTCNPTLSPNCDLYPTREHLVPLSQGGSSRMYNLVVACRKCNNTRHAAGWKPNIIKTVFKNVLPILIDLDRRGRVNL